MQIKTGVLFSAVCLLFASILPANEKIVVAAFEYPQIYQKSSNSGIALDLVREAFKAVAIDVEYKFYPVARMIASVSAGQSLCGVGGTVLFEKTEVASSVNIAAPVQYVSQVFLYNSKKYPNGITFDSLEQLSNYRIGVLFSSGINKLLEKSKNLKLETNPTHDGTAQQLQMGRVDLWAIVDITGLWYMKTQFPAEAKLYKYSKAFNRGDISVVFSKKRDPDNAYCNKFLKGLAIIKKNGTYMKTMAQYYGGVNKINQEALVDDMRK